MAGLCLHDDHSSCNCKNSTDDTDSSRSGSTGGRRVNYSGFGRRGIGGTVGGRHGRASFELLIETDNLSTSFGDELAIRRLVKLAAVLLARGAATAAGIGGTALVDLSLSGAGRGALTNGSIDASNRTVEGSDGDAEKANVIINLQAFLLSGISGTSIGNCRRRCWGRCRGRARWGSRRLVGRHIRGIGSRRHRRRVRQIADLLSTPFGDKTTLDLGTFGGVGSVVLLTTGAAGIGGTALVDFLGSSIIARRALALARTDAGHSTNFGA